MRRLSWLARACAVGAATLLAPAAALAQSPQTSPGDTAWVLSATALVLFMTLPGLALFYAGLVRVKNSLSVMTHCVGVACLMSIVWLVLGYSLAFDGQAPLIGGLSKLFLSGVRGAWPSKARL